MTDNDNIWFMVEGPDGAGKSNLARLIAGILSEDCGPTVLHKTRAGSELGEYRLRPEEWLIDFNIVQDRGAVSAAAYEPIKLHPLHPAIIDMIPQIVADDCMLIFVTASVSELVNRVTQRGDSYIKPEQLAAIVKSYDKALELWESCGGTYYEVDTSDDEFPDENYARMIVASMRVARDKGRRERATRS